MVEAGVGELADLGEMSIGIGPADDRLGHVLLGDRLRGLLEVARQR